MEMNFVFDMPGKLTLSGVKLFGNDCAGRIGDVMKILNLHKHVRAEENFWRRPSR